MGLRFLRWAHCQSAAFRQFIKLRLPMAQSRQAKPLDCLSQSNFKGRFPRDFPSDTSTRTGRCAAIDRHAMRLRVPGQWPFFALEKDAVTERTA